MQVRFNDMLYIQLNRNLDLQERLAREAVITHDLFI